jgi:UDP-N-acetylglucosamine 2-epimerase (non-hydrolysing)
MECSILCRKLGRQLRRLFSYSDLVFALDSADFVATDSGGIQEEAASLNKPELLLRRETDRPEATCRLVGVDEKKILAEIRRLAATTSQKPDQGLPFGDGTAGRQIALIVQDLLENALC